MHWCLFRHLAGRVHANLTTLDLDRGSWMWHPWVLISRLRNELCYKVWWVLFGPNRMFRCWHLTDEAHAYFADDAATLVMIWIPRIMFFPIFVTACGLEELYGKNDSWLSFDKSWRGMSFVAWVIISCVFCILLFKCMIWWMKWGYNLKWKFIHVLETSKNFMKRDPSSESRGTLRGVRNIEDYEWS